MVNQDLHDAIMRLTCTLTHKTPELRLAYSMGHRDARHAAAELSVAAPEQEPVNLLPVILWLEAGCSPEDAAKELRLYHEKQTAPQTRPFVTAELTDADLDAVTIRQWGEMNGSPLASHRAYARAVLAAQKAMGV